MKVLVAYESKHGATRGIAERIGETLRKRDLVVDVVRARDVGDAAIYDAFVIGSAVYYGSWMKEASDLVARERASLTARPVWLFSSGPIGTETTDAQGRDVRIAAEPKAIADLKTALSPRDHRVFFGALDRKQLGMADRLIASLPAFSGSEGDFRDWKDIETWADAIARELASAPAAATVAAAI